MIGLCLFLKSWRTGWPWLLVTAFLFPNGYLQLAVAQSGRTQALTALVGSIGEVPAFKLGLPLFMERLPRPHNRMPWERSPQKQTLRSDIDPREARVTSETLPPFATAVPLRTAPAAA